MDAVNNQLNTARGDLTNVNNQLNTANTDLTTARNNLNALPNSNDIRTLLQYLNGGDGSSPLIVAFILGESGLTAIPANF